VKPEKGKRMYLIYLKKIAKRLMRQLSDKSEKIRFPYHDLRGLNVEEVGGRRESQSPTPKRAVREGCHMCMCG
jgi:hypothetical protein